MAALVVLSTACLRVDMAVLVNDDGSGTITLTEAIDATALKKFADDFSSSLGGSSSSSQSTSSIFNFNEKDIDRSKLPPGTRVEAYKEGAFEGLRLSAPFQKPDEALIVLNKLTSSLSDQGSSLSSLGGSTGTTRPGATPTLARSGASSSGPPDSFERFTIVKQDGGWKFEAVVKPSSPTGTGADDPMTQALLAAVLKDASVTFSVRLPGKVTQTNADDVKGSDLKWNLPLTASQPKTLSAQTSGSGFGGGGEDNGFPLAPIAIVLIVGVLGVGLVVMSRRMQQPNPPAG
jgi:hypothetical protein